ncbi:hypothetical protein Q5P01_008062 [Channa striata]|uniref:Ig-like domain-containing protein n=1 Tax=Channa striata TaxID=64152 RepID=A0AA88SWX4_CHASR|nr:hypothetical protein Q5P01_008062 [Channa striata]
MSQIVLLIKLLLVHYATQSTGQTQADCNEDISLTCTGVDFDTAAFVSVTWYKFNNTKKLGIIRRGREANSIKPYNFTRTPVATFGEGYELLLQRVTPEDSGEYECAIFANVGGRNLNLLVKLEVNECMSEPELTTITTKFNTTMERCQERVEDLPVMWSIIGYLTLGICKIILCLLSIWAVQIHSSRSWKRTW